MEIECIHRKTQIESLHNIRYFKSFSFEMNSLCTNKDLMPEKTKGVIKPKHIYINSPLVCMDCKERKTDNNWYLQEGE